MKWVAAFTVAVLAAETAFSATVILSASKDNTLFESVTGMESDGAGDSFFAGRTGANDGSHIRRATIAFDVASTIPSNATVTAVKLTLFLAQGAPSSFGENVSLFSFTADWGEGSSMGFSGHPGGSTTGDATWLHRFYNTALWSTPGGDFNPQSSATTSITAAFQFYSWTGPGLVDDVQTWVGNPAANFGWIARGNETVTNTALRFNSRQATTQANRPQLTVDYIIVPEPSVIAVLIPGLVLLGLVTRRCRGAGSKLY